MGILLTFMFLWNMLGALILIPALSYFLLNGDRRRKETVVPQGQVVALKPHYSVGNGKS
ncbi:hypothetical protein D3C73_811610 [compost metagenome]